MPEVKFGALCWNQYTIGRSLLEAGIRADRLGYDTLWTWDHLYPIQGSSDGPIIEGWLTLAAWAQATERVRIGLMVGANTFRRPGLDRQDGDDARPHLGWARDPRDRRRLVRGGARRLRDRVRERLPGATPLAWRGAPDHARDAPRRATDGRRPAATRPPRSGTTRCPSRRTCRCSSAVAASRSRSSWSPATATRTTSAAGSPT